MDEHNVVVDIISNELVKTIREASPYNSTCCIYRVPPRLRRVNETAYTPTIVSIGPLHHGNGKSLQMMEDTKMRFVKNFTEQRNVSLKKCVEIVLEGEQRLRNCYQESFWSKDFRKIILVDAIFLVELFLTIYHEKLNLPPDPERMPDALRVLVEISLDLQLLENQLPFFILEDIWKCATEFPINRIFFEHFNSEISFHPKAETDLEKIINYTPEHFVDLVRKLYIPLEPKPSKTAKNFHAPSMTELRRAGVKFDVIESSNSLFDVDFPDGILKIPKWRIDDSTEITFRNLIAFEQCHFFGEEAYVCHYHYLMDYLVNTSGDINLLIEKKIIENWLGDNNEVSSMINKLGTGVSISSEFCFADIFYDLNSYCESRPRKWIVDFEEKYFNTPWTFISLCGALLLLILTIIQTVCSIISL